MWADLGAIFLLGLATRAAVAVCPRLCECKWRSGKESALCARTGLKSLPTPLDVGTQLLDLAGNHLNILPDDAFSKAGLLNLQKIYLSECDIRLLRRHTFRNLDNLVELDLSKNRLENIPAMALAAATQLRDLRLDKNPITKLSDDAFRALVCLVRLDLSDCLISKIEPKAFIGLENSLEFLELDSNKIRSLKSQSLSSLRKLRGIELANNPWHCTCELRPLRDWMLKHNVPATVAPECASPSRVASKTWDRLDLDDFACAPEVKPAEAHTSGYEGTEVTLACKVSGVPPPQVRWLKAGRLIANSTGGPISGSYRSILMRGEGPVSNLTIKIADVQDAGPYVCAAENRAGKAEASVTLAVEKRLQTMIGAKMILAAGSISALLVLILCIAALFIRESKKKRSVLWNEQIVMQNRREDNYEKIEVNKINNQSCPIDEQQVLNTLPTSLSKKRGAYRNVPSHDTEDEAEVYNERIEISEGPSKGIPWNQSMRQPHNIRKLPERWPPVGEPDLHIPRLADFTRTDSTPESAPSSTSTAVAGSTYQCEDSCNNNPPISQLITRPRTVVHGSERLDNDQSGSDSEKNYPDLLEMSNLNNSSKKHDSRPPPPDYSFCTLPRKRLAGTNSRSPLLSDSRYGSSGGDSSVGESFERRSSAEFQTLARRNSRRSNSTINLSSGVGGNRRNPSLPGTPEPPSATPLLDLSGLHEMRAVDPYHEMEQYDYQTTQLERFLEEYCSLREQLTKMKENRERNKLSKLVEGDDSYRGRPSVAVTAASSAATLPEAPSSLALSTSSYQPKDWMSRFSNKSDPYCS